MAPVEHSLSYSRIPVRLIVNDEGIWWAASDLYRATRRYTDRTHLACFDPAHLRLLTFSSPEGPVRLTAVSSLGAATIATTLPSNQARMLAGWVRKHNNALAAEAGHPRLELSLGADGALPVKPKAYTDADDAWKHLRAQHPNASRRPANRFEPALFDEDPTVLPHDPAGDDERFHTWMAERQRYLDENPAEAAKIAALMAERPWL